MIEKETSLSVHEQPVLESEQVAVALNPRRMGPLLEPFFGSESEKTGGQGGMHSAGDRRQACRILDAKYEPGSYCTILYQFGDQLITGGFKWDSDASEVPPTTMVIPSVGMRVYDFPNDPVLPGLPRALDPQTMSQALTGALPEFQVDSVRILRCDVKPLRFRPGRRCTVRLSLWLRAGESGTIIHRVLYGKIYHDLEKASRVFQQMLVLSDCVAARDGRIAFAGAAAFLPDLAMVLQNPIEGIALDSLISCETRGCDARGLAGTLAAASALAALHTSSLTAGKPRSISLELARFKKRGASIGQVNPELGREIIKLADALLAWLETLDRWGATFGLVHGDCKPAQFLIQDQGVALLDFDHCGIADPAVDVGTFLATLQQMNVKQNMKNHGRPAPCTDWMPGLKQQFLDAYRRASGYPPEFSQRAAWYEAVALLRKAIRGFERSPFSPLPAALVAEAWKELEALPPPLPS